MTMKKLIATLLVVMIMLGGITVPALAAAEKFSDVKSGAWYYTAVDYAVSEGLFSGTSADTFSPGSPMTRGMFVRVLGNKAKVDPGEYPSSSFSDVKAGTWYAPYVEWAAQNGIVTGTGNGRFSPNQSVTREQMAVILYNYAKFAGCDLTTRAGLLGQFSDENTVSKYARYAVEWAVTHKLLGGIDGRMNPKGTATRAQVAQIFYNSRGLLANGSEEPQPPTPSPSPDVTPSPEPTPDTDAPRISTSDEVRAKLKPNQDPEKILDYVLNGKHDDPTFAYDGTTARWDPALLASSDHARMAVGSWVNLDSDSRSSSAIGNLVQQVLTRTVSDTFYITAKDEDGYFCLYYHPAEVEDSQKMREIKALLRLPDSIQYDRSLCYEGAGWAGPMRWEQYHGAQGIAEKIEYYLTDMHQAIQYYLTEPTPGTFYLLYGE